MKVGPNSNKWRSIRPHENTQWEESYTTIESDFGVSDKPRSTEDCQQLLEARAFRGNIALQTPFFKTSRLQNHDRVHLLCFTPPICYSSLGN